MALPSPGGRTAYVVLSHAPPAQVGRLVHAIRRSSPSSAVVVAHDARHQPPLSTVDPWTDVWSHGLPTDWGSWELVEASLLALDRARRRFGADWFVLVSGHDYPTRDLAQWERELGDGPGGWIGTARPLDYTARWGRAQGVGDDDLTRYTFRWYRVPRWLLPAVTADGSWARVRRAVLHRCEPAVGLRYLSRGRGPHFGVRDLRSPFDATHPCVKGSQWLALDRPHLDHLLTALAPGTQLRRVFEHSVIPDEACLQSVLSWLGPPLPGPPVTHVESEPDGTVRVLTEGDLEAVAASGSPFCRKVDPVASAALLDALDARR